MGFPHPQPTKFQKSTPTWEPTPQPTKFRKLTPTTHHFQNLCGCGKPTTHAIFECGSHNPPSPWSRVRLFFDFSQNARQKSLIRIGRWGPCGDGFKLTFDILGGFYEILTTKNIDMLGYFFDICQRMLTFWGVLNPFDWNISIFSVLFTQFWNNGWHFRV